jgi:hypothetical protein
MTSPTPIHLAYCTNVHAGADLDSTLANLQQHAVAVKSKVTSDQPMGIGLWLSAKAVRQLIDSGRTSELATWMHQCGLAPVTLNGFPYGDFHGEVVKYDVYQPTWWDPARADYTRDLIQVLDAILPAELEGSISTLPIAWNDPAVQQDRLREAASQLLQIADELKQLEESSGRLIYLCLEPEPGCVLQRSEDVVRFFQDYLCAASDQAWIQRYIRVCHDVCHAAVMWEDQAAVLQRYVDAGILVGKIQVSSAIELDASSMSVDQRQAAIDQLSRFAEDRYLHQTTVHLESGLPAKFYDDLTLALAAARDQPRVEGRWRVHFHVPIYLQQFGALQSTRREILSCFAATNLQTQPCHIEVETYAWSVLPQELQHTKLADGIAAELNWLSSQPEYRAWQEGN